MARGTRRVLILMLLPIVTIAAGVWTRGRVSDQDTAVRQGVTVFMQGVKTCMNMTNPENCFETLVQEKAPLIGVEATMRGIEQAVVEYPEAYAEQCHRFAHYLGEYAGETVKDVDAALALGTEFCQFGYYHGVIEGHARITETLWEELPGLCYKLDPNPNTTTHAECTHSLGHAVVTRTGNNIPEGLKYCRLLRSEMERRACDTGVFMSWSNTLDKILNKGETPGEDFTIVDFRRRYEMCPPLDDETAAACVHFFAETAPVSPYTHDSLYRGLGEFLDWCGTAFPGRPDIVTDCYGASGRVLGGIGAFERAGEWPDIIPFCMNAGEDAWRKRCLSYTYSTAAQFRPDLVQRVCALWENRVGDGKAQRSEAEEQCLSAEELYGAVNGNIPEPGTAPTASSTTGA